MTLRLGTRASTLATTQSEWVADLLRARGHDVELVPVVTRGDTSRAPLSAIGGTGVFATALRDALRLGECDLAVHSLKDLPTAPAPGLFVAAIPRREDPRDVVVTRDGGGLDGLPAGAVIGSGSPRRRAQLAALGRDWGFAEVRGNVERRLSLVADGEVDATILARAGLARLGLLDRADEAIDPLLLLPAPGQGALAVECRADDTATRLVLEELDDPETRAAVTCERALLARLEAGCTAPVGALAEVVEGDDGLMLSLRAFVGAPDGSDALRSSSFGPLDQPEALGRALAEELLNDGAARFTQVPVPVLGEAKGEGDALAPTDTMTEQTNGV